MANKLIRAIKDKQSGLQITEKDVLCVTIAALFHDIGIKIICSNTNIDVHIYKCIENLNKINNAFKVC